MLPRKALFSSSLSSSTPSFAISVALSVPAVIKDATSDSDQKTPTVFCIQNFQIDLLPPFIIVLNLLFGLLREDRDKLFTVEKLKLTPVNFKP